MTVYYKVRQILLQNATAVLLQNATEADYKMRHVFCYKIQQFCYKMRRLLQIAAVHLSMIIDEKLRSVIAISFLGRIKRFIQECLFFSEKY